MAAVKRLFRQQSTRVASSSVQQCDVDTVEEETEKLCSLDDRALILQLDKPQIRKRRPPVHSHSFLCLFNENGQSFNASRKPSPRTVSTVTGSLLQNETDAKDNVDKFELLEVKGRQKTNAFAPLSATCASVRGGSGPNLSGRGSLRKRFGRTATFEDLAKLKDESVEAGCFRLNAPQRDLVRQCWHAAKKKRKNEDVGQFVFARLFDREPRLKMVFGLREVPFEELKQSTGFNKHAKALADVLEMVIDSVGSETDWPTTSASLDDVIGPYLCSYGAKHAAFESHKSKASGQDECLRNEDWLCVAESIREYADDSCHKSAWPTLGSLQKRNEALHAWRVLVHFIVTKIRRGYELEKERRRRFSRKTSTVQEDMNA